MQNDLIVMDGGVPILDPKVAQAITDFEREVKAIKEQEDLLKAKIIEEMENKGLLKVDTPNLILTYIGASVREIFDSKKLRADDPDLYDQYIRFTPVKASVRIKLK